MKRSIRGVHGVLLLGTVLLVGCGGEPEPEPAVPAPPTILPLPDTEAESAPAEAEPLAVLREEELEPVMLIVDDPVVMARERRRAESRKRRANRRGRRGRVPTALFPPMDTFL